MEALQLLVDMVKDLPDMAIWVILAFFFYKTLIVGSIYGVIKLAVIKTHDAIVTRKTQVVLKDIRGTLDGMLITGNFNALIGQLDRLKGIGCGGSTYIHDMDIRWLKNAIDEKLERELEKEKQKGRTTFG